MEKALPETALPAWNAYLAMGESKRRHFGYLEELENKYRYGGSRTIAESAHLESLLKTHDEEVARFRKAVSALKAEDPDAHRALIAHITMINTQPDNETRHS